MAPIIPMSIEANQLLLLLNWMSPAFPTGAFAYSHGLEWAIEAGDVTCTDDLKPWLEDLVTRGSGWNDAVIFARCWEDDADALNELALALASSKERHLETTQLGRSFLKAAEIFASPVEDHVSLLPQSGRRRRPVVRKHNGGDEGTREEQQGHAPFPLTSPITEQWVSFLSCSAGEDNIAYPVAAGTACAAMGIDRHHALLAYLQGFCAALTSVAVRLVPLGQTAGLETLRDLMPVIAATARRAASATLDDLGAITLSADIAAMKHETLHSRVFRT